MKNFIIGVVVTVGFVMLWDIYQFHTAARWFNLLRERDLALQERYETIKEYADLRKERNALWLEIDRLKRRNK